MRDLATICVRQGRGRCRPAKRPIEQPIGCRQSHKVRPALILVNLAEELEDFNDMTASDFSRLRAQLAICERKSTTRTSKEPIKSLSRKFLNPRNLS